MGNMDMRKAWEKTFDLYDKTVIESQIIGGVYVKCADKLAKCFGANCNIDVLDVASSSGEPSMTLAKAIPKSKIISTDIVAGCKALGERRAEAAGITNVKFETADAENLSAYSDGQFDAVVCSFGIMFIPNVSVALTEMRRVLKPGGLLVLTVWASIKTHAFLTFQQQLLKEVDPDQHGADEEVTASKLGADIQGFTSVVQAAGFADVDAQQEVVMFQMQHQALFTLIVQGLTLPTIMKKLTEQGQKDVDSLVKQKFDLLWNNSPHVKKDGTMEAPNTYYFVTARAAGLTTSIRADE